MKTKSQKLVKALDDKVRAKVKELAGYTCERCHEKGEQIGGDRTMHWAHIEGRGKREVRWGVYLKDGTYCWNAFCLCGGCHIKFDNAENRGENEDWLTKKLGKKNWNELKARARITKPWGIKDFEAKIIELDTI